MATSYSQGIYSNVRKKLGGAVWYMWNGLQVGREYRRTIANPNTMKQQLLRTRLKVLSGLAKLMRPMLTPAMTKQARAAHSTAYGWFVKSNQGAVTLSSPDDVSVAFSEIQVCSGRLPGVDVGSIDWGSTTHLHVVVPFALRDVQANYLGSRVYAMLAVPELGVSLISDVSYTQSSVEIECPASLNGMTAHVWLCCIGEDGSCSDSTYCGSDDIA